MSDSDSDTDLQKLRVSPSATSELPVLFCFLSPCVDLFEIKSELSKQLAPPKNTYNPQSSPAMIRGWKSPLHAWTAGNHN